MAAVVGRGAFGCKSGSRVDDATNTVLGHPQSLHAHARNNTMPAPILRPELWNHTSARWELSGLGCDPCCRPAAEQTVGRSAQTKWFCGCAKVHLLWAADGGHFSATCTHPRANMKNPSEFYVSWMLAHVWGGSRDQTWGLGGKHNVLPLQYAAQLGRMHLVCRNCHACISTL
jgi:hypothetical protein